MSCPPLYTPQKGQLCPCPEKGCESGISSFTCGGCFYQRPDPWAWAIVRPTGKTEYSYSFVNPWRVSSSGGYWWKWLYLEGGLHKTKHPSARCTALCDDPMKCS